MAGDNARVAIIGNGCAGAECLKALRESGYRGEIHLFTNTTWPIYNPMLTTYYVAGKIGFDGLFPYGNDDSFYRRYDVTVHSGSPVVALDAERKVVANQAGLEVRYDQCLVASGASPFLPPIPGVTSRRVYAMRTVEDAMRLRAAMEERPRTALVVGASMVGIKLVELFRKAEMEVCLADLAECVFPLAAHPSCAHVIEERLRDHGVRLRLGAGIERIEETATGVKAFFKGSDQCEEAELLLMCIGVRANTGFVDRAQVTVQQGILVDERMRASAPGLFAAGDVAQGANLLSGQRQVIGLWANARYQGRTAGRNMAGVAEEYSGTIPHNITHFMGMDFVGIGCTDGFDRVEEKSDGKRFMQLYWREGRLIGANFVDAYNEAGVVKNALIKGLTQPTGVSSRSLPIVQNLIIESIIGEVEKA